MKSLKEKPELIMKKSLTITISTKKWFMVYPLSLPTTQKIVYSSINFSVMLYILIKSYINSGLSFALHVPSVMYMTKPTASVLWMCATNLQCILQKKLIYWSLHQRVPPLLLSMFKIKTSSCLIIYF